MNWYKLENISQLSDIIEESKKQPVLIFKHSTRCNISATSLQRMERSWEDIGVKPYYLDLIAHRDISNAIADKFDVQHQSPQVILIKNGESVYDSSHFDISFEALKQVA